MKNGDMPAMPNGAVGLNDGCAYDALDVVPEEAWGLTKREYFACHLMAAVQGKLIGAANDHDGIKHLAETAVKQADALLAELEKDK